MVKTFMCDAKLALKPAFDYSSQPVPTILPPAENTALLQGVIPVEYAGLRLDVALARLFPEHSRARIQAWLRDGLIQIDGGVGRVPPFSAKHSGTIGEFELQATPAPTYKVHGGETVHIRPPQLTDQRDQAENIALAVVYEDDELIVVDKPAGLVVHPGNGNADGTLMNALLHHAPSLAQVPRAGIVHRLDKDTSGLLVIAKTLTAQTDLVRQLQARTVKRYYLALVHGHVNRDGLVDAELGRHPVHRTKMAVVRGGGREARTHYFVRERFAKVSLLECHLDTGRTHQIRVHMASIGHPLVGDPVYGKSKSSDARLDAFRRQALHAWQLSLIHPKDGAVMAWEAPVPQDFDDLLTQIRDV